MLAKTTFALLIAIFAILLVKASNAELSGDEDPYPVQRLINQVNNGADRPTRDDGSSVQTDDGLTERPRRHVGSVASFRGFPKTSGLPTAHQNLPSAKASTFGLYAAAAGGLDYSLLDRSIAKYKRYPLVKGQSRFIPVAALGNYYKERQHFAPHYNEAKSRALNKLIRLMSQVQTNSGRPQTRKSEDRDRWDLAIGKRMEEVVPPEEEEEHPDSAEFNAAKAKFLDFLLRELE